MMRGWGGKSRHEPPASYNVILLPAAAILRCVHEIAYIFSPSISVCAGNLPSQQLYMYSYMPHCIYDLYVGYIRHIYMYICRLRPAIFTMQSHHHWLRVCASCAYTNKSIKLMVRNARAPHERSTNKARNDYMTKYGITDCFF